jgi:hypothetical protein
MLKLKKLTTIIAAAAMTFSLAACGAKRLTDEEKEKIAGTYELTAFDGQDPNDPDAVTAEDLQEIKAHGYPCTMEINSNGTAVLDLFGETQSLTWDKDSFKTQDGTTISYVVSDKTLTLSQESTSYKMVFTKLDVPEATDAVEDATDEKADKAFEEAKDAAENAEEAPAENKSN